LWQVMVMVPRDCSLRKLSLFAVVLLAVYGFSGVPGQTAEKPIDIDLTDDSFQPAEVHAKFGFPFTLRFYNKTSRPAEVESSGMRFEKVIAAGAEVIVKVRPVEAGTYEFYNDFKPTMKGHVVVGE
jgi:plastocyanin